MDKTSLQKRFRFIMVIAALAMFITIVTPAYIRYGSNQGWPKVIMMWTVLFGKGGKNQFSFSWFAFTGYISIIVLLIISLLRKFITIDTNSDTEKKKSKTKNDSGSIVLDSVSLVVILVALVMFILLPILITETSCTNTYLVDRYYGWGFSYILIYIALAVMLLSCLGALYINLVYSVLKNIKGKKSEKKVEATPVKEEVKDEKTPKKAKKEKQVKEKKETVVKEEVVEGPKEETKEEAKEETNE